MEIAGRDPGTSEETSAVKGRDETTVGVQVERLEVEPVAPEQRHRVFLITVFAVLTLAFAGLLARLVEIQIVDRDFYVARAARYHMFERQTAAARGRILDRRGTVIAESVPVKTLWARPAKIASRDRVARTLAPLLGVEASEVRARLDQPYSSVCLAEAIDASESIGKIERAVRALARKGDTGLDMHDSFRRVYPAGSELAHVIGAVGDDGRGLMGIERLFNSSLEGAAGYEGLERDGRTRPFYSSRISRVASTPGSDVVLTIDSVVQHFLERQVQWAYDTWDAESVIGIVISPPDGKILAMANRPTFDPGMLSRASADSLKNRAVIDPFAPGSTFKPFIVAAALEERVIDASNTYDCGEGRYRFDGRLVRDVHPKGILDVTEVLVHSSNIGIAQIGLTLGGRRVRDYVRAFGFGSRSGIGLGGETAGKITSVRNWTEKYTTVSVSFGQEISVTPLQLSLGFSALINGGRYHPPHLVDAVIRPDGSIERFLGEIPRDVISPQVSEAVRGMLVRVVEEGSSSTVARIPGYRVGGKTGTSEKWKGKVKDGYVSSFIAFAPAENPEVCCLVMVNEPKGQHYGRVVAAPAVARVLTDSLAYLEVPPTVAPSEDSALSDGGISRSAGGEVSRPFNMEAN